MGTRGLESRKGDAYSHRIGIDARRGSTGARGEDSYKEKRERG